VKPVAFMVTRLNSFGVADAIMETKLVNFRTVVKQEIVRAQLAGIHVN
jgi:hypothetical protein